MRRRGIAVAAVCVMGVLGIGLSLRSADRPPKGASMEFRRKFLADFKHIILDTTAGDRNFPRVFPRAPIEVNKGTRFSTLVMEFEAHEDGSGVLWNTTVT